MIELSMLFVRLLHPWNTRHSMGTASQRRAVSMHYWKVVNDVVSKNIGDGESLTITATMLKSLHD